MYNHNTMISHDARRTASVLFVLAASLGANHAVVDAFAVLPSATTTKYSSALDISTTIPHAPPSPSLADRFLDEVAEAVKPKRRSKKRQQAKTRRTEGTTERQRPPELATVSAIEDNVLILDEQEVRRRKMEWAGRYTSVEALRETFGANKNRLWGDLQASTARRLYKTLLPRALLELSQLGVGQLQPQDLAPLAYQARVAAKMYARERCTVPARIAATVFDGFRQWMKYGKFQGNGMTYDQLWQKYAEKICQETEHTSTKVVEENVCLKIIERSCVSNSGVDKLVLKNGSNDNNNNNNPELEKRQQRLLERIHAQLEQDMYELLLPQNVVVRSSPSLPCGQHHRDMRRRPWSKRNHLLMLRLMARQRRLTELQRKQQQQRLVLKP